LFRASHKSKQTTKDKTMEINTFLLDIIDLDLLLMTGLVYMDKVHYIPDLLNYLNSKKKEMK
jgi:hypothetical protein